MIDGHAGRSSDAQLVGMTQPTSHGKIIRSTSISKTTPTRHRRGFDIECPLPWSRRRRRNSTCALKINAGQGFEITDFTMHDPTGKGYAFPKDADDAIWSKIGIDCPDEAWGKNEVFAPKRVIRPTR